MTEQLRDVNDTNHSGSNQPLLTVQITNDSKKVYELIDFEEETLRSISRLEKVLRKIRRRMISEGYEIKNGTIVKA